MRLYLIQRACTIVSLTFMRLHKWYCEVVAISSHLPTGNNDDQSITTIHSISVCVPTFPSLSTLQHHYQFFSCFLHHHMLFTRQCTRHFLIYAVGCVMPYTPLLTITIITCTTISSYSTITFYLTTCRYLPVVTSYQVKDYHQHYFTTSTVHPHVFDVTFKRYNRMRSPHP